MLWSITEVTIAPAASGVPGKSLATFPERSTGPAEGVATTVDEVPGMTVGGGTVGAVVAVACSGLAVTDCGYEVDVGGTIVVVGTGPVLGDGARIGMVALVVLAWTAGSSPG